MGSSSRVQRVLALLRGGLEGREAHGVRLVEGGNARAPQRDEMAEAAELGAHVAGQRAHVGALAAAGLEHGGVAVRHVEEGEGVDLHRSRFQLDDLARARQVVGAVAVDLDGGEGRRRLQDLAGEARQQGLDGLAAGAQLAASR